MVDCGSPRCAQSRRSFRRDLQLWGKKLPVLLGLERIAADYVDKETSELLLHPYPEWEKSMTCDFESTKKCFHCDKKLPNVYRRIHRIIDEAKRGKVSNGKICLRSLQDLMPFCVDFYKHGFGHELFSESVREYFTNAASVATEPLPSKVTEVPPPELSSYPGVDCSNSQPVPSPARPGRTKEGTLNRQIPVTAVSSSSVLAPVDNSLNRLRVPNVTSSRVQRINERQQKEVIKHEPLSVTEEDKSNLKRPWQNNICIKSNSHCATNQNHWKGQDSHRSRQTHKSNSDKSLHAVNCEDYPFHQKRLRPHQRYNAVEVIISDSEEEVNSRFYQRSSNHQCERHIRNHQHKLDREQHHQSTKEDKMSALELFESAHRRLRLEQLEQLGTFGNLEHEQHQQHLETMRSAASASLFRLANQHLLPPGMDHSPFSAASASVAPAPAALPFLLPILPCSLKLKLEGEEEDMVSRREMLDREEYLRKTSHLNKRHFDERDDQTFPNKYQNKSRGISSVDLRAHNHESVEMLQHQCRLDNLRRMHNLNGVVKQEERQEEIVEDRYKPMTTRCVATTHTENEQHEFYQKELKLPLLTNLVRKLVHQKFEEITQKSRQASHRESTARDNLEGPQTHSQRMSAQHRKEESFASYNPYLTPIPTHFLTAALASKDENIATPMYNYIMESIYTNMMKEESNPAPNPFRPVHEDVPKSDALKDITIKGVSQKSHPTDSNRREDDGLCTNTSETSQSGCAVAPLTKSRIWSPAFSAVSSDIEMKDKKGGNQESFSNNKEIVSPPAKRPKNHTKNKYDCERRSTALSESTAVIASNGSGNGKKTRPKRGQYRKYNSQLLMDAVKAVQRGEMSVHRAGSFYGVPHSTLEYKVKERHLLRQKKPREAGESSDSKTASEASPPQVPNSSTSTSVCLKAPTKPRRALRTQSQDSCSSVDGETSVTENTAVLHKNSQRKYKKAHTAGDSSSSRSSVSSSTPPSPGLSPLSPPIGPAPVLNLPVSSLTSTSPPSSPPPLTSPQPVSPHTATTREDKPPISNSLGSSAAWFQPYLDVATSMQQVIGSTSTKSSPSTLDSLGHTNSASELLRKLQHKVQAKESGVDPGLTGTISPSADGGVGALEIVCGQDRRAYDLYCQPHRQGSPGKSGPLQDRLMLYKQSA